MKVKLNSSPAMTVHRQILKKKKVVYLLVGPRATSYQDGKSRIVYIGTTSRGARRIAASAAYRAAEVLQLRGFRHMDIHVVTCGGKRGVKSWQLLERGLLALFRSRYHQLPICNRQGRRFRWDTKLSGCFRREALEALLARFDSSAVG